MNTSVRDAQQLGLSFLISQATHIEQQVWSVRYPDITYQDFVPVDTSAPDWVKTITFFATDQSGRAAWINGNSRDIPLVGTNRQKFESTVEMAAIGYEYNLEELNQARTYGINLDADRAKAARRAYEEYVEEIAYVGDTAKGFKGLFNASTPGRADVVDGASTNPEWSTKTADEILKDVNDALTGIWIATKTVAMADTLLLPLAQYSLIATKRLDATSQVTILEWIEKNNIYTKITGQKLTIRANRKLAAAGSGGTDRMVAYRKSPEVVKLHIPKTLEFLPPQQVVFNYIVPGMFRLGGTDIRLPAEIRYYDAI